MDGGTSICRAHLEILEILMDKVLRHFLGWHIGGLSLIEKVPEMDPAGIF